MTLMPTKKIDDFKNQAIDNTIDHLKLISNDSNRLINAKNVKPFLKWKRKKNRLLKEIRNYYPFMNKNITKYAEPFVGGGAVLFDILLKYDLEEFYISDINKELIDTYQVIRDNPNKLVKILSNMQMEFTSLTIDDRKDYYLQKRERFNFLKMNNNEVIEKAALMIFLNRTCFNGLFRVNKKGLFNVPMGAYKNPLICDKENIYVVEGPRIERMLGYTNLDSEKGFSFFQKFLHTSGIIKELEALGIEEGGTVKMYGLQFDYYK